MDLFSYDILGNKKGDAMFYVGSILRRILAPPPQYFVGVCPLAIPQFPRP